MTIANHVKLHAFITSESHKACMHLILDTCFSRNQSPMAGVASSSQRLFHSPGMRSSPSAAAAGLSRTPLSFSATSWQDNLRPQEGLEPTPEICLDHLWTENAGIRCRTGHRRACVHVCMLLLGCKQQHRIERLDVTSSFML